MSSRLLVSGATGMIGSLLTDALVARGVEFSVLLRPGDSGERIAGKPGVTSTEGDFNDPPSLQKALEGVDRAFLLTNSTERTEAQQIAFVEAARDIATVAAAALAEQGHVGKTYTITGPAAVTHAKIANSLGNAIGRPVRFESIPPEAFIAALTGVGMPNWQAEGLAEDYA